MAGSTLERRYTLAVFEIKATNSRGTGVTSEAGECWILSHPEPTYQYQSVGVPCFVTSSTLDPKGYTKQKRKEEANKIQAFAVAAQFLLRTLAGPPTYSSSCLLNNINRKTGTPVSEISN